MLRYIIMILVPGVLLVLLAAQRRWQGPRKLAQNLLVSYTFIVLVLAGAELYLRYGFAQSENVFTWANQNWLDRYWQTNSLDFRDREWTPADWEGKTTIALVGDSFAAGSGTDDPRDRFGDVLAAHLGDDYALVNMGRYGTATPEQLEILQNHPLQEPDIVILQYYLNDINYALLSVGLLPEPPKPPRWARKSALGNFLYFRLRTIEEPNEPDWRAMNFNAYDSPVIWEMHKAEIEALIEHVESVDARLIVVIFPDMLDPYRSIAYVDRVAQVFEDHGHDEILRLFNETAAWGLEERIVSYRDTHPSAAFHRRVGDMLYEQFFAEEAAPGV